ncbi:putative pre-mRNA-splicing factor ATP-dependent RNA helicase DHX16 [Galleria mellonella]|uniref:Pre-mRNA-splicing factor ATP-dependent RNA helicase DHX16 n=1 Tax=Galleria mellonella TaxID=7137 RepID=A0A6J3C5W5_GALME|nr:putative pre-mRNA-splicing factor ATP-dependent RNA helicase DHX16 [Galleria mellonella]XP_052759208.1 putative pre-mRNA-splicing factor ATP-dependent RNA helicase DHX16 [Galleria mellonella]
MKFILALSFLFLHHVTSTSCRTISQSKESTHNEVPATLEEKSVIDLILSLLRTSQDAIDRSEHLKEINEELRKVENNDRLVEILPMKSNLKSKGGKAPLALILTSKKHDRNQNDKKHDYVKYHYKQSHDNNSNEEERMSEDNNAIEKITDNHDENHYINQDDSEIKNNYELEKDVASDSDIVDYKPEITKDFDDTNTVKDEFDSKDMSYNTHDKLNTYNNDLKSLNKDDLQEPQLEDVNDLERSGNSYENYDKSQQLQENENKLSKSNGNVGWQMVSKESFTMIPAKESVELNNKNSNEEVNNDDDLKEMSLKVFSKSGDASYSDTNDVDDSSNDFKLSSRIEERDEIIENQFIKNNKDVVGVVEATETGHNDSKQVCDNDKTKEIHHQTHKSYNFSFLFSK